MTTVAFPTLDEIKEALEIDASDPSHDEAIEAMLASTITIIEGYLGRGIAFAHELEEFIPPESRLDVLLLRRYPVSSIQSVTLDGSPISDYWLYKSSGVVRWRNRHGARVPCESAGEIVCEYDGGYPDDAWPADLADAVMRAFYGRWQATEGSGNIASIVGGPGNRSISIDGLTITRDSASYAGSAFALQVIPPELANVAAQLDPYRARRVGGV